MSDKIKNMAEHYTLNEIKSLKSLLEKGEKRIHVGSGSNFYKLSKILENTKVIF